MGKNIIIGLSGGPSAAINSSLAGILSAASKARAEDNSFGKIYGAMHGIEGVLSDNIIELDRYCDEQSLALLQQTPAMALGSCRHKINKENFALIEKMLNKYDVGYFFYIGGNDSMDTVLQLSSYFKAKGSPIKVIGVPKTIDNDLPVTDHTPGYGSSAKYLYHTMSEIIRDSRIYPIESVVIVEVMGRNSGWLTLAAALPRFLGKAAPQIIAIPEIAFDETEFIKQVNSSLKQSKSVICVISEGIKDTSGNYIGMSTKSGAVDIFGHTYLSGVGKYLEGLVTKEIGCKVRSIELNIMQRAAAHLASKADIDEAMQIGEKAIEAAKEGRTGITMIFERITNSPYTIKITYTDVLYIANKAKDVPPCWHNLEDKQVQSEIAAYILPLIKGDTIQQKDETGLPIYIDLV